MIKFTLDVRDVQIFYALIYSYNNIFFINLLEIAPLGERSCRIAPGGLGGLGDLGAYLFIFIFRSKIDRRF